MPPLYPQVPFCDGGATLTLNLYILHFKHRSFCAGSQVCLMEVLSRATPRVAAHLVRSCFLDKVAQSCCTTSALTCSFRARVTSGLIFVGALSRPLSSQGFLWMLGRLSPRELCSMGCGMRMHSCEYSALRLGPKVSYSHTVWPFFQALPLSFARLHQSGLRLFPPH